MATDKIKYDTVTLQCTRENPPYCVATKVTESGLGGSYSATRTELDTLGATGKKTFTDFYDTTKKPTHALTPRSTIPPPKTGAPPTLSLIQPGPIELAINEEKLTSDFITVGAGIDAEYKLDPMGIASGDKQRPPQIKGVKPGNTTLTVTNKNNRTQSVSIKVIVTEASTPPPANTLSFKGEVDTVRSKNYIITDLSKIPNLSADVVNPIGSKIIWNIPNEEIITLNSTDGTIKNLNKAGTVNVTASIGTNIGTNIDTQLTFNITVGDAAIAKPPSSLELASGGQVINFPVDSTALTTRINTNDGDFKLNVQPSGTPIVWSSSNDKVATVKDNGEITIINRDEIGKGGVTITASVGPSKTQIVVFTLVNALEEEEPTFEYTDPKNKNINGMVGTAIDLNRLVTVTPEGTDIVWTTETDDKSVAFLTPGKPTVFIANRNGTYVVNGTANGKKLEITITVERPTIKSAKSDVNITKRDGDYINLNADYVNVTNIDINRVDWYIHNTEDDTYTKLVKTMGINVLTYNDMPYELIGTVAIGLTDPKTQLAGIADDQKVTFKVTVDSVEGGRRRRSKGTMKGKLGKLRRRMGTRVKRG